MTEKQLDEVLDLAEELRVDTEVRSGYSGRGMYGKTTNAIIVDNLWAGKQLNEKIEEMYGYKLRVDGMGLGMVMY